MKRSALLLLGLSVCTLISLLQGGCHCCPKDADAGPRVVNAADYRKTVRGPVLLHFTEQQWEEAIVGFKESDTLKEEEAVLVASPMPGVRGGMLVGIPPRCPPGCTPIMRYEEPVIPPDPTPGPGPDPFGRGDGHVSYTPHPDEIIYPQCDCPPDYGIPEIPGGSTPPAVGTCRLVIRLGQRGTLTARTIFFDCLDVDCTGSCRLEFRRQPNGTILIACGCR